MDAYSELGMLGAALGGLNWVQGPGGNVSVKTDGELWVKASGTRLALVANNVAKVPQAWVMSALAGDPAAERGVFAVSPRPSLETYFHALGARVVAHTHPVGTLLAACSTVPDAVKVDRVRYERPGLGLAVAVREQLDAGQSERALLLDSHGLIVYANSAEAAIRLTHQIDSEVRSQFPGVPDFEAYAADYMARESVAFEGGLARPLPARSVGEPRYLFPDAVVYASHCRVPDLTPGTASDALSLLGRPAVLIDTSGRRLAVARSREQLSFAVEIAAAHDWVEDVLTAAKCARYLPADEPAKILNLPSEQYRLQLQTKESTAC